MTLNAWLQDNNYGKVRNTHTLSGGCINQVARVETDNGASFCLKQNNNAPADFFACEAEGLRALADTNSVRVPEVIYVDDDCLLLEFIDGAGRTNDYWQRLAQQLAACHQQSQTSFGFHRDNYCGETPQPNQPMPDGYQFFAEQRLLTQCQWARDKGLLNRGHCRQIDNLCQKLEQWIPPQAPALIHGDLWGGNLHSDEQGQPVLIDPACYWGWPEADLAMTTLFGGFADGFYQHYQECQPLQSGWHERLPLYNLYHLLNHLNLFGGGYLMQVESVLDRFA